uniref:Uncharacterized protein n=1 Tax=Arundo donax TaxID=35708 RepID=A0A0A9H4L0_ARUDO
MLVIFKSTSYSGRSVPRKALYKVLYQ